MFNFVRIVCGVISNKRLMQNVYTLTPQVKTNKRQAQASRRDNMKIKDLITKLQKLEKTTSGEVSFKLASPNWAEGDILHELNLVLLENADDVFTEIIFENQQTSKQKG